MVICSLLEHPANTFISCPSASDLMQLLVRIQLRIAKHIITNKEIAEKSHTTPIIKAPERLFSNNDLPNTDTEAKGTPRSNTSSRGPACKRKNKFFLLEFRGATDHKIHSSARVTVLESRFYRSVKRKK